MKTKAPHPIPDLQINSHPIIKIYFEFAHLKQLYRQGWLARGIPAERCESVAEHTFAAAVTGMLLADTYYPYLDSLKILRMTLIHDFGEVYVGDIIPGDDIPSEQKHQREKDSVTRIFNGFPQGEIYLDVWEEFETNTTLEARFVRQIDKLEMALQASVYEHQNLGNLPEFFRSAGKEIFSPELKSILKELEALRA